MTTIGNIDTLKELLSSDKVDGLTIGLVPTMGFLHDGHMALLRAARTENDRVVLSIFVNPSQFGPGEDFASYPRDLDRDMTMAKAAGVDYVFVPTEAEMYPREQLATVEVSGLTEGLCSAHRPGHFKGVTTVVAKLLNIVKPDRLYMGKKDAQQLLVIDRMVKDLNFDVKVIALDTVREADGLAMSSRNYLLGTEARQAAGLIPEALKAAKTAIDEGERNSADIEVVILKVLSSSPLLEIQYISIVDRRDMSVIETIQGPILVALAVKAGGVRLIDNLWLDV